MITAPAANNALFLNFSGNQSLSEQAICQRIPKDYLLVAQKEYESQKALEKLKGLSLVKKLFSLEFWQLG